MAPWHPSKYTRAQLEERRLAALNMIQAGGHTNQQIADHFGVSIHTVYTWKERLKRQGGLEATPTTGRPARLTPEGQQKISTLLQEGALAHGFPDSTWTTARVREVIGRHLDVWYHVDHVRKVLHRLGFSPQKPGKGALEQNEEAVRTWVQTTRPGVEKKIAQGATLVYLDEVGFSLKGVLRRTWAKRGKTPVVRLPASWQKLSTIGAITSNGQFLQRTQTGAVKTGDVLAFLNHLLKHVTGELVVVLDNAAIHRAKAVSAFVETQDRLSLVYLPPYSPEFNPIEKVWAYVKRNVLGNFCARTTKELRTRLRAGWQRIRYIQLPQRLMAATSI
ncbi:IS630 family transposase [Deinococcus sp. LM3]|uniref:IS630 family transposase n=1 Tax=Deinococcus sp. LM3 TaxID=1938608 RepID=UPI00196B9750|nr:IS630 family transposase [Deinococcus sp. LM3]